MCFALLLSLSLIPPVFSGTISEPLQAQLDQLSETDFIVIGIEMADKLDIHALDRELKLRRATRQQRHYEVITAAQEWAQRSQAEVADLLAQRSGEDRVRRFEQFWITNAIFAEVQKSVVYELADRTDVRMLHINYEARINEPVEIRQEGSSLRSVEPGLRVINAPQCWAMGITGEGRLISNMDSGVDGNHPALADRWRGVHEPWEECWFAPTAPNSQFPEPISGSHGTHVMGTECGASANDTVGVAWAAEWIAAGLPMQFTTWHYIDSFEWLADPDGDPETIDDVPDAVNNSWRFHNASYDCQNLFNEAIEICEAGGCAVIFAAGNEGPGSATIGNPPNQIMSPYTVFSVGAVNGHSSPPYPIANFSSRGPSDCDNETIKPEVSAPGVDIRSTLPGGSYGQMSGTSMAAPHVTGVCALLRQVDPNLEVDEMKDILMVTAVDQGTPGEDNTFGFGVIDAYAAVMETFARLAAFEGTVTDAESGETLRETRVYIEDTNFETLSDMEGFYHLSVQPGEYIISAERFGYYDFISEISYTVASEETVMVDIQLDARPQGIFHGTITSVRGYPLEGVEITPIGVPVDPFYTDAEGNYNVSLAGDYEYTFWVYAPDHDPQEIHIFVPANGEVEHNMELTFVRSFETSDENFVPSGNRSEWEWGEPQESGGPAYAYSGVNVWGTDLDDLYEPQRRYDLFTPTYRLQIVDDARLVFYTWYEMSEGWDGGNVAISTDAGTTWNLIEPDGGYPDQSVVGLNGQAGFTGETDGWLRVEFPLMDYMGEDVQFRFRFASTNDTERGWFIDNMILYGEEITVGVEAEQTTIHTPRRYALHQNYPNPFNPFTIITYEIPNTGHVSLKVYDGSGKLVRTLVDDEQPAGSYQVEWNGRQDNQRPLASGIYYYQLTSGEFSQMRRMVLLK